MDKSNCISCHKFLLRESTKQFPDACFFNGQVESVFDPCFTCGQKWCPFGPMYFLWTNQTHFWTHIFFIDTSWEFPLHILYGQVWRIITGPMRFLKIHQWYFQTHDLTMDSLGLISGTCCSYGQCGREFKLECFLMYWSDKVVSVL
jgi:hypothetical protein